MARARNGRNIEKGLAQHSNTHATPAAKSLETLARHHSRQCQTVGCVMVRHATREDMASRKCRAAGSRPLRQTQPHDDLHMQKTGSAWPPLSCTTTCVHISQRTLQRTTIKCCKSQRTARGMRMKISLCRSLGNCKTRGSTRHTTHLGSICSTAWAPLPGGVKRRSTGMAGMACGRFGARKQAWLQRTARVKRGGGVGKWE